MKNTLRVLVAVASLAIAAPAFAQGGGGMGGRGGTPEERMARQKTQLFEGITLNADQSKKADSIMMDGMKKQTEMMQAGGMEMMRSEEGRAKMQAMTADRNKALKALLDAAQGEIFDKNVAAMAGRGRGGQ